MCRAPQSAGFTGRRWPAAPACSSDGWSHRLAGLPLVVVDTADTGDPRAVDWAARTAAGVILRLAGTGGCRVLLPGDQVATTVTDLTAAWRGVHRRLALLQPAQPGRRAGTAGSRRGTRPPRPGCPCARRGAWLRSHGRCRRAWLRRRPSGGPAHDWPRGCAGAPPGQGRHGDGDGGAGGHWGGELVVGAARIAGRDRAGGGGGGGDGLAGGGAAGLPPGRRAAGGVVAAAVWAAGVPAGQLLPSAWPLLLARLAGGVGRLTALGSTGGPIGNDPWPLVAWLLGAGAVWVAGAALAASGPSARRRAIAFGLLAAPWIAAVAAAPQRPGGLAGRRRAAGRAAVVRRTGAWPCGRRWRWVWSSRWCRWPSRRPSAREPRGSPEPPPRAPHRRFAPWTPS